MILLYRGYRIKKIVGIGSGVLLLLCLGTALFAQQPAQKDKVSKEIGGRVSGLSKDYIAITYQTDEATHTEREVLLPLDKSLVFEHVKDLGQIKAGDTVAVQFEEYTETTKEGPKTFRKAKGISFVSPAPKEAASDVLGGK